jgi:carbon-monoxide dehydrogenase large subunit
VLERLIDTAADQLGFDRVALRRQNLIPDAAMPYRTAMGVNYDCGAFGTGMDAVLKLSDWDGFPTRREASQARGKLRGIGIVNAIERAASPGLEFAEIRFNPGGSAIVLMGSKNQGQGHETMFKQIVHEKLGLDPHETQYIDGDTDRVAFGIGTMGSRSTVIGGSALTVAADKVLVKARKIAAHLMEAAEADLEFADGKFTVAGTDKAVTIKQVAQAAFQPARLPPGLEPGLYETGTFTPKQDTFPNGAHVCEVEVDPDTGAVQLLRYAVSDDVGTVMNPLGLKGQIHGGVAQGLGQALMEQVIYDPESGQLLTGSFVDYAMPRADTTCNIDIVSNGVPTTLNPLGAKGAGEAGTVGALPVIVCAVLDALKPLGVKDIDMPVTSERVWRAINAARAAQSP